jgi:aminopeptidase-like protein
MKRPFDCKQLIRRLSPLRMAPNSSGADECIALLCEFLPFHIHEFSSGMECNGWIVPEKWEVKAASIHDSSGRMIYDATKHPLAVIGYSQSFSGTISGAELRNHLFYSSVFDDALVYHCDLFYKPFRKEWGFSVPRTFYNSISPKQQYHINLVTCFSSGTMKVAEYTLLGKSSESIILNAHNCHAFCCNDDLSGVGVGIQVMNRIKAWKSRRLTYKFIVGPEHFGSIFYLNALGGKKLANLKSGVFLESLGTTGPLALQRSFLGNTTIDSALQLALRDSGAEWRTEPFRKVVGNDETCWEAVGYEIPFPSLSRVPFPEYHTSRDCPALMSREALDQAADVVTAALHILETDCVGHATFKGLVALSHPRYDLYKPFWDPSEKGRLSVSDSQKRWNYLMDCIPRYFDGKTAASDIAYRHDLPYENIRKYFEQFNEKRLVSLEPAPLQREVPKALPPH